MVAELLLTGTEEQVAEGLAAYRQAGLRTPVASSRTVLATPVCAGCLKLSRRPAQ